MTTCANYEADIPCDVEAPVKGRRGRKRYLTDEQVRYCRDNPEQLSYSELGQRFKVSVQVVRRAILGRGCYAEVD